MASRVDAPHAGVVGHAIDGQHVGCGPSIDLVLVSITTQIIETCDHCVLQPLVDDVLAPEVAHPVLNPLKIRDCNAAGVGQDVWDNENTILMQYFVCPCRCWPIGPFCQYFALDSMSVLGCDLILRCSRNQYIALQFQQFAVGNPLYPFVTFK